MRVWAVKGTTAKPDCANSRSRMPKRSLASTTTLRRVIHLKDIIKSGIRDNFADLRAMGIKTVMVTGDMPAEPHRQVRAR